MRINDGVAHFSGLATCGSVWACPVCAPKIRQRRAVEIGTAVAVALQRGLGAEFVTLTVRHHRDQSLQALWDGSEGAWKGLQQQRRWREATARLGVHGYIAVREVTVGKANGWHPHRHMVVLTEKPWTEAQRREFEDMLWEVWNAQLVKRGLDSLRSVGALVKRCTAAEGMGWYLAKVEGRTGLGLEMARGDLKDGRRPGHRSAEQLQADAVEGGESVDVRLWQEYERVSKGRRMMSWTVGLRAELLGAEVEPTDEELAAAEVGGGLVASFDGHVWRWLRTFSPGAVGVLEAAEAGQAALFAYMAEVMAAPGAPAADWEPGHGFDTGWAIGGSAWTVERGSPGSIAS